MVEKVEVSKESPTAAKVKPVAKAKSAKKISKLRVLSHEKNKNKQIGICFSA